MNLGIWIYEIYIPDKKQTISSDSLPILLNTLRKYCNILLYIHNAVVPHTDLNSKQIARSFVSFLYLFTHTFVSFIVVLYCNLHKNTNTPHRPAPISQTNTAHVLAADTLRPLNIQNLFQAYRSTIALTVAASLDRRLYREARSRIGIRFCPNWIEFITRRQRIIIALTVAGGKSINSIYFCFHRALLLNKKKRHTLSRKVL